MRPAITLLVVSAVSCVIFSPSSKADQEPTPQDIIDRAITACGGAEKIRQFKAGSFKGKVVIKGEQAGEQKEVEISGIFAPPSLLRLELVKKPDSVVFVSGGDTFWIKTGKEAAQEAHEGSGDKEGFDQVRGLIQIIGLPDQLLALKGKDYNLTILGDEAVNGVQAVALRVNHPLRPEAFIYFDKETGLPLKSKFKSPLRKERNLQERSLLFGEVIETFFEDFKEIDGVLHYTKLKVRAGTVIDVRLRELKFLKKLDAKAFKKPE